MRKGTEVFGGNPISISSWTRTPVTATLRDQLAMAAPYEEILWLLAGGEQKDIDKVCAACYEWADAMVKARKDK